MPRYNEQDPVDEAEYEEWESPPLWQRLLPLVVALVIGMIVGLVVGGQAFGGNSATSKATSEACLVLASELYAKGESLEVVKGHLQNLGYDKPSTTLLKLAESYEVSGTSLQKSQSTSLRRLANAIQASEGKPLAAATAAPGAQPSPTATKTGPTATAVKLAPTTPTVAAAPTAITYPTKGKITGSQGAIMRKLPSSTSDMVQTLVENTKIDVLDVVQGEAVNANDSTWYKVKVDNNTGYVYGRLVTIGN